MKILLKKIIILPKILAQGLIEAYQLLLSPDHSWLAARFPYGYCRHYPSCSQYAKQALERFGLIKGSWLVLKRLLRCHPWSEPKVDLVPNS